MEVDQPGCIALPHGESPTAIVCRVVEMDTFPDWNAGPIPFCQPSSTETVGRGMHLTTDAAARTTLVSPDLAPVLYDPTVRRWIPTDEEISGHHVLAVEVCAVGDGLTALVAVHLRDAGVATLSRRPGSREAVDFWAQLQVRHLGDATYTGTAIRTVTFTTASPEGALLAAYAAITGIGEGTDQRSASHALTVQKPDWSALVLRDGLAVVSHPSEDVTFAAHLQVQTHSVYLDALLLAWNQRILLDGSGARAVRARLDVPDELVDLERRHYDFKRTAWRRRLTQKRTSPVDDVLAGLQRELLTDRDVEDVEERVHDGARLARTLHQEENSRAQEQLNRTVQRAAVVIGAFGLAYSAAPTLAAPSVALFLWTSLAAFAAMVFALIVLAWSHRR